MLSNEEFTESAEQTVEVLVQSHFLGAWYLLNDDIQVPGNLMEFNMSNEVVSRKSLLSSSLSLLNTISEPEWTFPALFQDVSNILSETLVKDFIALLKMQFFSKSWRVAKVVSTLRLGRTTHHLY